MHKQAKRKYKSQMQDDEMSLKEKVLYSLLAAAGITGVTVVAVKFGKQLIANSSEVKSFENGTPATYAKQIRLGLENKGGFGVNVNAVRNVLRQIKSQQELNAVSHEYWKQTGKIMNADLGSALKSSEYTEMLLIMSSKTDSNTLGVSDAQVKSWAMRLNYAFIGEWGWGLPGTDEDAIRAVFSEIPTKADYKRVETAYFNEYGQTLKDALLFELEEWEKSEFEAIINSKPAA